LNARRVKTKFGLRIMAALAIFDAQMRKNT
jgi:hypothetical protein